MEMLLLMLIVTAVSGNPLQIVQDPPLMIVQNAPADEQMRGDERINLQGSLAPVHEITCGGVYNADQPGSFSSPDFSEDEQCLWKLHSPDPSKVINLRCQVPELFSENVLLISKDGRYLKETTVSYGLGTQTVDITSVTNDMGMFFSTEDSMAAFTCYYRTTSKPATPAISKGMLQNSKATPASAQCGGILSADVPGHFQTPNYPNKYNSEDECFWRIESRYSKPFTIKCEINVEDSNFDILLVSADGQFTPSKSVRFSGMFQKQKIFIHSSTGRIGAYFHSDSITEYSGVHCSWEGA